MATDSLKHVSVEDLRKERIRREAEYLTSELGYIDFIRQCGAAPDAQQDPHGRYAQDLIHWNGTEDPEAPGRIIYKYKLVLWPRGSFKTQAFDIGHVCWVIARDRNVRVLIASETDKQSNKIVGAIMRIVDSQWFRERFGVRRGTEWRKGFFVDATRDRQGIKEPTLQATGVGSVQTGAHWDYVFMDDVCSQENTTSPEMIEKLWNWFGETLAQLDPGCKLFIIGTLHHFADIYCKIQKDQRLREMFEISIHAWSDPVIDPDSKVPAKLFFPGRLTRKYVSNQKRGMSSRLYACFYENKPFTEDTQIFKPQYFRVIEERDIPSSVWTYIFTDWAFIADEKKKGRADRTCFWVVSIDCNRVAYVRDFVVGRWKPTDSVRVACDLWSQYQTINTKAIGVEATTHKDLILSIFEEVRRQTFVRPHFVEIEGRNQETKDRRIESMEPRWRRGDIYISRRVRDSFTYKWKPMLDEMTEWPFSEHDDIPDALSDIDKQNPQTMAYYFPSPPNDWMPNVAARYEAPTIDGRFNPRVQFGAKTPRQEHDIWGAKSSTGAPDSLFKGQQQGSGDLFKSQ